MKRNIFITVFVAVAISAGLFVSKGDKAQVEEQVSKKLPKEQRIAEALEWRKSLMVDPATGEFSMDMYYDAVKKADELKFQSAKSGALNLQWELVGPDNVGGRTRALMFDKVVPNKLWAGSVGGGLFVSPDGGNNWERVESYDGFFSIASITQASDGALYVGTGEGLGNSLSGAGNGLNSQSPGNGVYKSTDGGASWRLLPGTEATNTNQVVGGGCQWCGVNDIAVSPTNDNIVLAATQNGLFVSTQAGEEAVWQQASGLGGEGQAIEITSDGLTAYAAFNGRVYRSLDAVNNFTSGWSIMPVTGGQRADVAIAPSNENYVYASVTGNNQCLSGIWLSRDAGDTWDKVVEGGAPYVLDPFNQPTTDFGSCEGQGWYDQTIAVNPVDETKLYIGGITFYTWGEGVGLKRADVIGTEGGDPFNSKFIHADKHEIIFNPLDPSGNTMLVGSDGGVTLCSNANAGFPDALNFVVKNKAYATLQIYGMGAGAFGETFAGTQDNGTQYIDGLGASSKGAQRVIGGDGVYAEVSNLDPDVLFGGVYFGDLQRSVNRGVSSNSFLDANIDQASCGKITCTNGPSACQSNYASFIYPFYLMETSMVGQQDTTATLRARNDTLLLASGATQIINDTLFPTYQVTVTTTISETGTTVEREVIDKSTYTFTSRVSDAITFEEAITTVVLPGQTLRTNDPYDAKYFVPSTGCGLWMCINPLQKNREPVFYRIANFSNAQAFDNSADGDILFFSVSNRVYRITGLNLIHQTLDPNGCFNTSCAPNLNVTLLATISGSGTIQGIAVDKSNADHVLVTSAGFGTNSKVYRIEDATTNSPNVVNLHQSNTTLPWMPVYDCVIDYSNPDHYIIGSELGIWSSNDAGQTWSEENEGMFGRMPVYRLRQEYLYEEGCMVLYAGTHGGGTFRTTSLLAAGCDPVPFQWEKLNTGIDEVEVAASNIGLFPNPVNTQANMRFDLSLNSEVNIKIIDLSGRVIMNQRVGTMSSGTHIVPINTTDLASGSYFAVLSANRKMVGSKLFIRK
jgi:hypothetical protein